MYKTVNASVIPKTLKDRLLELKVGKAIEIPRDKQAQALSIIFYYKKMPEYSARIYRSKKKDDKTCYIIREQ